ncbi:kinesin [Novymonas esmeraldas]|uniref:Kinesin n=1 Tax=Novymonas esmeraldas TaxID=1808958 RepID=A0AAW0EQM0_9TRYP
MIVASIQSSVDGESVSSTNTRASVAAASAARLPHMNETSATKVFVRVRPFSAAECGKGAGAESPAIVSVSDDQPCQITSLDPAKGFQPKATYVFDRCFNSAATSIADTPQRRLFGGAGDVAAPMSLATTTTTTASMPRPLLDSLARDQAAVYEHVGRPVLLNALAGYNGCVFAYGQTGSGKTYTMMGPPGTLGAAAAAAVAAGGCNTNDGGAACATTAAPGRRFRRAATAYSGALCSTTEATADDAGDSRFQSFASMTPQSHLCRTPGAGGRHGETTTRTPTPTPMAMTAAAALPQSSDAPSPTESNVTPRSDVAGHRPRRTAKGHYAEEGEEQQQLLGIVPRLVRELFAELHRKRERDSSHSFRVEVEYYEIYREKVMDLLGSSSGGGSGVELRVRHSKANGPYVENLKRMHVEDEREVLRLLRLGNMHRHTAATAMNDRSSRSHAIFVLHLVQMRISEKDGTSAKVSSKVNLVDLAGSERTGANSAEGDQFKEGVVINNSLTVLGRVIDALADKSSGKRNAYCPYRDSVLTWLLMDSLGGNSKTTMVATISPHASSFDEACQTLRYASRAKQIVTKVIVNEDPQARQIKLLTAEVQRLKALLSADGKAAEDNEDDLEALRERVESLEEELDEVRGELEQKTSELAAVVASSRRGTGTLPTTLKPSHTGTAGVAKELAKAKSDMRRLEAENLLHMHTEEELHRATERIKTVERRHSQLLGDMREAQEVAKRLDREAHEKDKRISELQQQLALYQQSPQQRARPETPRTAATPTTAATAFLLSPRPVSELFAATVATPTTTTTTVTTPRTARKAAAAPPPVLPPDAVDASADAGKKTRKAKSAAPLPGAAPSASAPSASTAAAPPLPQRRTSEWLIEAARLRAQFEEEKKDLSVLLQERTDAFRKSQLELRRMKAEMKGTQDALQTVEKRLHDQHAEATRRLNEELQEAKRSLKERRRLSRDPRHTASHHADDGPARSSTTAVLQATEEEEELAREEVAQLETAMRQPLTDMVTLSLSALEQAAEAHWRDASRLEELQAAAEQQSAALATADAAQATLTARLAASVDAREELGRVVEDLQQQLEAARAAREEAAAAHQAAAAAHEEERAALRERVAELQSTTESQSQEEEHLQALRAAAEKQLSEAQEQHAVTVQHLEAELKSRALAAAAAAAAHAGQLAAAEAATAALQQERATEAAAMQSRVDEEQDKLRKSEDARRTLVLRGIEQSQEHDAAVRAWQAQLEESTNTAAAAATLHEEETATLRTALAEHKTTTTTRIAALEAAADAAHAELSAARVDWGATAAELEAQRDAALREQALMRETLDCEVRRAAAQATAHEEAVQLLHRELAAERAAAATAASEHTASLAAAAAELRAHQDEQTRVSAALTHQVTELQSKLASTESILEEERRRAGDLAATQAATLVELQNAMASAQAEHAAAVESHEVQLRAAVDQHARDEQAAQAEVEALTAESAELRASLTAAAAASAETQRSLEMRVAEAEAALGRSEEMCRRQLQEASAQTAAHDTAVARLREEVQEKCTAHAVAVQSHGEALAAAEAKRLSESLAASEAAAASERQLEAMRHATQQERAEAAAARHALQRELDATRTELQASEQARKTHIRRAVDQSAAHEQTEVELRSQLASVRARGEAAEAALEARVRELQEHLAQQADAAAHSRAEVTATLERERLTAQQAAAEQRRLLSGAESEAATLRASLAESEEARTAQTQRAVEQSAAHERALGELQATLQSQQRDSARTAAAHAAALHEWEERWQQQEAATQAEMATLQHQAEARRLADAAAASSEHAAAMEALRSVLSATEGQLSDMKSARTAEAELHTRQAQEQSETFAETQAELTRLHEARMAAAAAAHEAAVLALREAMVEKQRSAALEVAAVREQLRDAEERLRTSEEGHRREAAAAAAAHAKVLAEHRRAAETELRQKLAELAASKDTETDLVRVQLDTQRQMSQQLQTDLAHTRGQVRRMVETQTDLGAQVEAERRATADLRRELAGTEAQLQDRSAAAAQLGEALALAKAEIAALATETATLSGELTCTTQTATELRGHLEAAENVSKELSAELAAQTAALTDASDAADRLRTDVDELQTRCAAMEGANAALVSQQEALTAQHVDTLTELEAQFRTNESERRAEVQRAQQTEAELRAVVDAQEKELQRLRDNLEFGAALDLCEEEVTHRDSIVGAPLDSTTRTTAAAATNAGAGVSGSTFSNNTSFAGPSGSAGLHGNGGGGGFGNMFNSFFSRRNSTITPLTAVPATAGEMPVRPFSVKDRSTTTPVRRRTAGGALYRTGVQRPATAASSALLFGKAGAGAAVAMSANPAVSTSATHTPVHDALDLTPVQQTDSGSGGVAGSTPLGNRAPNIALGRK